MTSASINDLPDSDFAYIEPGGSKDASGKTVPRSLRHFPVHDAAHVRNALARAPQSPHGDKAMPKIRSAAKRLGVEVSDDSDKASASRAEFVRPWALEDIHILRSADGGDGRTVEAFAAVFGESAEIHDHQGDYLEVIDPGAFNRAIDHASRARGGFPGSVKVLWNHGRDLSGNPSDRFTMPIGIPVEIRAEARGLLTRTRYSETPLADEVLENIRNGSITSQSFVGAIMRSTPQLTRGGKYRPGPGGYQTVTRTELGLREYGPVLYPAYSGAEIFGVRMSTPGSWSPDPDDEQDPGTSPDGEPAAGDPLTRADDGEHSARYHQHELYRMTSEEARQKVGLVWLSARKGGAGMAALKDILAEQARIKDELRRMENDQETTEEDGGNLRDTLIERWKELDDQAKPIIERMARIKEITRTAADEANLERPGGADGTSASRYGSPVSPEFMQRHDPFENLDQVRRGMITREDAIARALNAIEGHARRGLLPGDHAEAATHKAQGQPLVARHMLLTGSEDYCEAFRAYLEDPLGAGKQQAERAMTLATGQGGFLLPYVLDPTIVLTSAGSTNPYRQLAAVKQTTSNAWQGVNSAGITAQLLAEAVTATDATPTMGQIQIWPQKFAAWVFGSFESEQDTNFAEQLPGLLADAKDIAEELQFAVGTGGTGNSTAPSGVLHALGAPPEGRRRAGHRRGAVRHRRERRRRRVQPPGRPRRPVPQVQVRRVGREHHLHQQAPRPRPVRRLELLGELRGRHPRAAPRQADPRVPVADVGDGHRDRHRVRRHDLRRLVEVLCGGQDRYEHDLRAHDHRHRQRSQPPDRASRVVLFLACRFRCRDCQRLQVARERLLTCGNTQLQNIQQAPRGGPVPMPGRPSVMGRAGVTVSHPVQEGGKVPASSAAQHGEKSFPAGSDPASITQVSGLPADHPTMVGSPVTPEIRQTTPVSEMGAGYREASEDDPR